MGVSRYKYHGRDEMKVLILRGISGSGKSTLAKNLVEKYGGKAIIVSADDFFTQDGVYTFDVKRLGQAHGYCLKLFIELVEQAHSGVSPYELVVVDNTNTRAAEFAPYYHIATAFEVPVKILTLLIQLEVAWERNQHATSMEVLLRQRENLLTPLPPWYENSYRVMSAGVDFAHFEDFLKSF